MAQLPVRRRVRETNNNANYSKIESFPIIIIAGPLLKTKLGIREAT